MIYPEISSSTPLSYMRLYGKGTHVWQKPVGISFVYMMSTAGAGGGGGGYIGTGRGGAGGGGGASIIWAAPAMFVPENLTFSIGEGGAGGLPGSAGTNGSAGTSTVITYPALNQTFVSLSPGNGGAAGPAGTGSATGGTGGTAPSATYFTSLGFGKLRAGTNGGTGGSSGGSILAKSVLGVGGSGGGSAFGGAIVSPWTFLQSGQGFSVAGEPGSQFTAFQNLYPFLMISGGGGAAGGIALPANGGNGSFGCGGGGGAQASAGNPGSKGGNGGDGFVLMAGF